VFCRETEKKNTEGAKAATPNGGSFVKGVGDQNQGGGQLRENGKK